MRCEKYYLMEKCLFEQTGGTYFRVGDYMLPDLLQSQEGTKPIGLWGQRHARYLKIHRKVTYYNLLTSGRLNRYLADIDVQAEDMFFRLVKEYDDKQGITEQLKAEKALEWVGKMNNIRACAREVVEKEIVYC